VPVGADFVLRATLGFLILKFQEFCAKMAQNSPGLPLALLLLYHDSNTVYTPRYSYFRLRRRRRLAHNRAFASPTSSYVLASCHGLACQ